MHEEEAALVEVALVLSGIGLGVSSPSVASSVANVVDQSALGTAAATQQLMTQISTVAGIQVIQTVQSSLAHGHGQALLPSFHAAFLVGGAVAVGGVVCAVFVRSADRTSGGQTSRKRGQFSATVLRGSRPTKVFTTATPSSSAAAITRFRCSTYTWASARSGERGLG